MIDITRRAVCTVPLYLEGVFFLPEPNHKHQTSKKSDEPKDCCYRERVISRKVHIRNSKKALLRYLLGGILFRLVAVLLTSKSESKRVKKRFRRSLGK